jgi:3-oxoacyl-[acyl-carrier-protein] synthase II
MSTDPKLLDHRGRPRAVVTGIGVKSPAGCDVDTFWSTVVSGRSTAKRTQLFDPSELPVQFGCEVLDFDPVAYLGPKESRRLDRFAQLGVCAAADAFEDAGELGADPARCAVVTGTGVGGIHTLEEQQPIFMEKGALRVSPFYVPMMMANAAAGHISMRFRFTGPNVNITTACAAGSNAIGEALRLIRDDTSDVVMAGGCEAGMTAMTVAAFARMGALSTRNEAPELASRPFDIDRDGFVIGEGAAFFVMESLERALARGAHIYGEVTGYGRNADAHHITAPAPGGVGAAACMQLALDDARIDAAQVVHINAHGTSTPLNDAGEAEAIAKVFGEQAPPVTSTKGVTGHLIAAAGAVEAVATVLALREGVVPPTANHERNDEGTTLDVVHGTPRPFEPGPVVSNSFGFGGHNASLVLSPPPAV